MAQGMGREGMADMATETKTIRELSKTCRIGTLDTGNRRRASLYVTIRYRDGRLSITGVTGPLAGGNALGSCGQNVRDVLAVDSFAPGWDKAMARKFYEVWDRWHLNDMRAGSQPQEDWLQANPLKPEEYRYPKSHYEVALAKLAEAGLSPDAEGYVYGSAWKREEVPADVLEWLESLPDTDKTPAWYC